MAALFIYDGCVALLADTLAAGDDGWRRAMIETLSKRVRCGTLSVIEKARPLAEPRR